MLKHIVVSEAECHGKCETCRITLCRHHPASKNKSKPSEKKNS